MSRAMGPNQAGNSFTICKVKMPHNHGAETDLADAAHPSAP